MTKILKIIYESIGYLSGFMLYYIWCFIVLLIETNSFFKEEIINHIIIGNYITSSIAFSWLIFGLSGGIIIIGAHYLIYSIFMDEIQKIRDIKTMKFLFLTSIIWVIVGVIIDLLQLDILFMYVYGGLFIQVIVIIYFGRIPITLNKSNQVNQSD